MTTDEKVVAAFWGFFWTLIATVIAAVVFGEAWKRCGG
jgi:hypothetical protein